MVSKPKRTSQMKNQINRRNFIKESSLSAGILAFPTFLSFPQQSKEGLHILGPLDSYSPHIGALVSMFRWIINSVNIEVSSLSIEELDFVYDSESNSIGSLLLHLAATEASYQVNTFEERKFNREETSKWEAARDLGEKARQQIKGHDIVYYQQIRSEIHEKTLAGFRERDDKWLAKIDPSFFSQQPTNNYAKWFHVIEHEANHRGQITWFKKRLPGYEFENAKK